MNNSGELWLCLLYATAMPLKKISLLQVDRDYIVVAEEEKVFSILSLNIHFHFPCK